MAFNDGEPLDAAKLGALELQINNLAANIPKIGSSTTSVTVDQSVTNPSINIPQIIGKNVGTAWELKPGDNSRPIQFDAPMNSSPKSVVISARHSGGETWHPAINVKTGTITKDGFTAHVYMPTGTKKHNVYISYIAISY